MDKNKLLVFLVLPLIFISALILYLSNRTQVGGLGSTVVNKIQQVVSNNSEVRRIKNGKGEEFPFLFHFGTENFFTVPGILTQNGLLEKDGVKYIRVFVPDNDGKPVYVNAYFQPNQEEFTLFALEDAQINFDEKEYKTLVSRLDQLLKKNDQVMLYVKLTEEEYKKLQENPPSEYNVSYVYAAAVITPTN